MLESADTFFWGIEPKYAIVQRSNGRVLMTDESTANILSIPQVFTSKIPLCLVDLSTVKNYKSDLIDNSCCVNWGLEAVDGACDPSWMTLSRRWLDFSYVFPGNDLQLIEKNFRVFDIDTDMRQQLFLYRALVRESLNYYKSDTADSLAYLEILYKLFSTNLFLDDIYKNILSLELDLFTMETLTYLPRKFKYA